MNNEEKEAIEELKKFSNLIIEGGIPNSIIVNKLKIVFNLIDKLQKENEDMREELQMYVDTDIMKLQEENKDLKKEIDNLIKENHKHIDYIASMKKKQEDKIRDKIKELEKTTAEELRYDFLMNRDEVKRAVIEILEEVLGDDE